MDFDTIILGAGAAGLMCAGLGAGRTLVVDHARAAGEKIRISGGGRCNFTNRDTGPANFISANKHFHKSALSGYTPQDFIALVNRHGIAWHEKTLGQLFCDQSAKQIVKMLMDEIAGRGGQVVLNTSIMGVTKHPDGFSVQLESEGKTRRVTAPRVVVATGGKSIPKMGATGIAYDIARQFGHMIIETRPALVPFTFGDARFVPLAGVAVPVRARADFAAFDEAMLFTHRGLSGPAMLQVSSYWRESEAVFVNLFPQGDPYEDLRAERQAAGRRQMHKVLGSRMPTRLAEYLAENLALRGNLADQNDKALRALCDRLTGWELRPSGTEGYRTAEVTLGGVDTDGISSKTMMSKTVQGLYFIGECVDVTGWLGGYNFQWAWASAAAASRAISAELAVNG